MGDPDPTVIHSGVRHMANAKQARRTPRPIVAPGDQDNEKYGRKFRTGSSQMPRHLISDAHEWINEIPTVPIYYLAKPQPRERAWQN